MFLNPVHHEQTKHIDINFHFTRNYVQSGFIQSFHIKSKLHVANIFTEALGRAKLYPFLFKLNLSYHSVEFEGGMQEVQKEEVNYLMAADSIYSVHVVVSSPIGGVPL